MPGEVRDGAHDPSGNVCGQIRNPRDVRENDEDEVVDEERSDRNERVADQTREHAPGVGERPEIGGGVAVEVDGPDFDRIDPRERVHGEDEHVHLRLVPSRPHLVVHPAGERLGEQPHAGLGVPDRGAHLETEERRRDAVPDPALHRHRPGVQALSQGELRARVFC